MDTVYSQSKLESHTHTHHTCIDTGIVGKIQRKIVRSIPEHPEHG